MSRLIELLQKIEPASKKWQEKACKGSEHKYARGGSRGRLEVIAARLAGIGRTLTPDLSRKMILTMAGDHGVAVERVGAYPQEVTGQMVCSFTQGRGCRNLRVHRCPPPVLPVVNRKSRSRARLWRELSA